MQWDTSEHDWLEGRGERFYLIHMIDDATSQLTARFVRHDSTEENMRLLWTYLERYGRPVAFYTDKASLFQTAPNIAVCRSAARRARVPPTQIGRALREMGIVWIPAHSPQANAYASYCTSSELSGTTDIVNRRDESFIPCAFFGRPETGGS